MTIKYGKDKGIAFVTLPCGTTYQISADKVKGLVVKYGAEVVE